MLRSQLLLIIALVQGIWVRQRTPRLPVPVGTHGRIGIGLGVPLRVVGIGDSVMAGTGVAQQCHSVTATYAGLLQQRLQRDVDWRVQGFNGATSAEVLEKLAPAVQRAHVYIISCGVNDATHGVTPQRFSANLARILEVLRRKSPRSVIVFGGLPPLDCFPALPWPLRAVLSSRARQMQAAAAELIATLERAHCFAFPGQLTAEQFASDGFHPGKHACERWAAGLLSLWPAAAGGIDAIAQDAEDLVDELSSRGGSYALTSERRRELRTMPPAAPGDTTVPRPARPVARATVRRPR